MGTGLGELIFSSNLIRNQMKLPLGGDWVGRAHCLSKFNDNYFSATAIAVGELFRAGRHVDIDYF